MQSNTSGMITSIHNPTVQFVRSLLTDKDARAETGLFVVEGIRLSEEAVNHGITPHSAFFTSQLSNRGSKLITVLQENGVQTLELAPELMSKISDTVTSQGILLVVAQDTTPLLTVPDLVLILDQVRDPGNLGTILRTAAGLGVQLVFLTPGSVDPYMPKVVRSAMGAHFHLKIRTADWPQVIHLCKEVSAVPLDLILADSNGGQSMWEADLAKPLALVVGSEAEGPGPEARHRADSIVHIPMPGKFESLNAGVAASILLVEIIRQRHS